MTQFSTDVLLLFLLTCLELWPAGSQALVNGPKFFLLVSESDTSQTRFIMKLDSDSGKPVEIRTTKSSWDTSLAANGASETICWTSTDHNSKSRDIIICSNSWGKGDLSYPNVPRGKNYDASEKKPWLLELSPFGDHLFWQSVDADGLFVTNLKTNSSLRYLKTLDGSSISSFTVDWFNGIIFWVSKSAETTIWKSWMKEGADSYHNSDRIGSPSPVLGITFNWETKTLYWLTQTSLWQKSYNNDCYQLTMAQVNSPTSNSLKYYNNQLFWTEGAFSAIQYLVIYDLEKKRTERKSLDLTSRVMGGFVVVSKDQTRGRKDVCKELECSHLCLPVEKGKPRCACPWGLELKSESECGGRSVAVFVTKNRPTANLTGILIQELQDKVQDSDRDVETWLVDASIKQIFPTDKYKDTFCYTHPTLAKPITCLSRNKDKSYSRKEVKTLSNLNASYTVIHLRIRSDNDYVLWLGTSGDTDCLKYFESKTGHVWTLPCVPGMDFVKPGVVDEENWIIFWQNSSAIYKTDIWGKLINKMMLIDPFTTNGPFIALDTKHKKLYTFHSNNLFETDYNGKSSAIFSYSQNTRVSSLFFQNDRLYYIEHWGKEDYVVTLEPRLRIKDRIFRSAPGTYFKFLAVQTDKAEKRKTSCTHSPCSHFCLVLEESRYYCKCPKELPYLFNKKTCKRPEIIAVLSEMNIKILQSLENTAGIRQILLASINEPIWTLANARTKQLCWNADTTKPNHTVCETIAPSNKPLPNLELKSYPIFLAMSPTGDKVYWKDRQDGCIQISALSNFQNSLNTSVCEEDVGGNDDKTFVDTSRGLIFWVAGSDGVLYFRALHSNSSRNRFNTVKGITSITGNEFKGILYLMIGKSVKSIRYEKLKVDGEPTDVCTMSYKSSGGFHYHSGYLFWIGGYNKPGEFVQVYRTFDDGMGMSKEPPFTTIKSDSSILNIQIFEPSEEEYDWDYPCRSNPCSHFCLIDDPMNFSQSPVVKCYCPGSFGDVHSANCDPILYQVLVGLGGVLGCSGMIGALLYCYIVIQRIPKPPKGPKQGWKPKELRNVLSLFLEGDAEAAGRAPNEIERARFLPFTAIIESGEKTVDYRTTLGEGNFGTVYSGTYKQQSVAVKTFKEGTYLDIIILQDFLKELKVMAYIGDHANIVKFFGADMQGMKSGRIEVVLELSPQGSLEKYLRKFSKTFRSDVVQMSDLRDEDEVGGDQGSGQERRDLGFTDFLTYSTQIADGMEYLEQKHVVHGDLATRNVLVFNNGTVVKISDFGFARNLYGNSLYRPQAVKVLPFRWAAIETLERFDFSTPADVWSYGVTLWEIYSMGNIPFLCHGWDDAFISYLKDGNRLKKPEYAPDYIYNDIMLPCWNLDPDLRPSFKDMSAYFWNIYETLKMGVDSV